MAQADRTGVHASIEGVARAEKINPSYVGWLLRLTLLAPEIIEAILEERQLVGVTVAGLLTPFPVVWAERDIAPAGRRRPELASLHRGMSRKPNPDLPSGKVIRGLLERYDCPVPWHEVRTRFLGNLATPAMRVSPMRIVRDLWGGELPVFDTIDEANELIGALVNGLWNSLTKHQKRSEPFRLVRLIAEPTPQNLAALARTRRQELDGFIEGLFNGEDQMDLPQRAHVAVGHLSEMRAMMAGIEELVAGDPKSETRTELEATFKHLRELTRIMELEIHEAVLSCARARKHLLKAFPTQKPTVH